MCVFIYFLMCVCVCVWSALNWEHTVDYNSSKARQPSLPARGKSAREFSFARCHDEASFFVMLHDSAVGNTSKTGSSTSPATEGCGKISAFGIEDVKTVDCCLRIARPGRNGQRQ